MFSNIKCLLIYSFLTFGLHEQMSAQHLVEFDDPAVEQTSSGYFQLSWHIDSPDPSRTYGFELQASNDKGFDQVSTLYEGPDYATFISGLADGIYYYRIKVKSADNTQTAWSSVKTIEVKHHSLALAFSLFGMGAIVFLITVGIVVQGSRTVSTNI